MNNPVIRDLGDAGLRVQVGTYCGIRLGCDPTIHRMSDVLDRGDVSVCLRASDSAWPVRSPVAPVGVTCGRPTSFGCDLVVVFRRHKGIFRAKRK